MLRSELTTAARRIQASLQVSGIPELFDEIVQSRGEQGLEAQHILSVFQKYQHEMQRFSTAEHRLLEIFGLDELSDTTCWASLLQGDKGPRHPLELAFNVRGKIKFSAEYVPKIIKLLERETPGLTDDAHIGETDRTSIFSILLVEEPNHLSSPDRIILALSSVQKLYEGCARLVGERENQVSVAACDSGSDKSFDFLGVAKVFEQIRGVVNDLWDRIVYYRERKVEQRLELIKTSLPIIEQVDNMTKNGNCSREDGELIKRKILDGIGEFLQSGAMMPELAERSTYNPRELLAPQPKLLTEVKVSDRDTQETSEQRSPEELKKFEEILKKLSPKEREAWLSGLDAPPDQEE